jgi:hypothetical protein
MLRSPGTSIGATGVNSLVPIALALTILVSLGSFSSYAHAQVAGTDGQELDNPGLHKFGRPTVISNRWSPMKAGSRWIYEGTTVEDDGKTVPHRVEIVVTDLVKDVAGVCTVVSYDLDYSDGELVEAELALFAQDDNGNVWQFGEYPEEYEDGKLIKAPTWIHGFEGAMAGITMKAEPRLGSPSYSQGWGPSVGWTDRGITHQMGVETSVPAGDFKDVLVIREAAHSEPDAQQLKYYAAGVGNVRVGWTGQGDKTKETLELTKVEQLGPEALEAIRTKALELEKSGYARSKNVYALTLPAVLHKPDTSCR